MVQIHGYNYARFVELHVSTKKIMQVLVQPSFSALPACVTYFKERYFRQGTVEKNDFNLH